MRFKHENKVEVLRRTKEQLGFWYPGKIISSDGSQYTIRYDLLLNPKGEPVVENVCIEDVRPKPSPTKREGKWVIGDIVEVFDLNCWKVGKIAKVLHKNRIVIRLFGSIQLKEFHESNLRVRQTWHNNKWVAVVKDGGDRQNNNNNLITSSKFSRGLGRESPRQSTHKLTSLRDRKDLEKFKNSDRLKTSKRKLDSHFESALDDAITKIGGKKRNALAKMAKNDRFPKKEKTGKNCMIRFSRMDDESEQTRNYTLGPCSMPSRVITEESNECSVASCSSNYLLEYNHRSSKISSNNVNDSYSDDAASFFPSISKKKYLQESCGDDELLRENDVHKLELHAYKSTVQAFYASGPLSWEQESLLTNLRLSLNISNEEHLLQLRQLLSAQVL